MKNFQTSTLLDELFSEINAGSSSCFGIKREPDWENHLALYNRRRRIIVTNFALSLRTASGCQFAFHQDNFQGIILLDGRGKKSNRARLVLISEDGVPQLASDYDQIWGQIIVAADQAIGADPKLFGVKAVFGEDEEGSSSILLYDGSRELTSLWTMEAQLMQQEANKFGMRAI